jgi:hypothetical protein
MRIIRRQGIRQHDADASSHGSGAQAELRENAPLVEALAVKVTRIDEVILQHGAACYDCT